MKSCIYEGHVRHRRFLPVQNQFRYSLFMVYMDLEELPYLFRDNWFWSAGRFNLAWFRQRDHFGGSQQNLADCVREHVLEQTGKTLTGDIRLLTQLRCFGYCFNPVSFFYCFDESCESVGTIVTEIQNTPWLERHLYVLDESENCATGDRKRFCFQKKFHISPFMPMEIDYDWRFSTPGDALNVHMISRMENNTAFDATLTLRRREWSSRSLRRAWLRHPLMTWKVTAMIYWQALRLRIKGAPFHTHPKKVEDAAPGSGQ